MSWKGVKKQSIKAEIEAWCDEMWIEDYTINSKGEIDVDGSVNLFNKDIKELPYKFGTVIGYFSLGDNKNLISLKNCPNEVRGYFNCSICPQLDSLKGCPKKVGGNFWCGSYNYSFTKEEVKSLCLVKCSIYNC